MATTQLNEQQEKKITTKISINILNRLTLK
jgi:hypothetical protein